MPTLFAYTLKLPVLYIQNEKETFQKPASDQKILCCADIKFYTVSNLHLFVYILCYFPNMISDGVATFKDSIYINTA